MTRTIFSARLDLSSARSNSAITFRFLNILLGQAAALAGVEHSNACIAALVTSRVTSYSDCIRNRVNGPLSLMNMRGHANQGWTRWRSAGMAVSISAGIDDDDEVEGCPIPAAVVLPRAPCEVSDSLMIPGPSSGKPESRDAVFRKNDLR
jgi:hypothetical protein